MKISITSLAIASLVACVIGCGQVAVKTINTPNAQKSPKVTLSGKPPKAGVEPGAVKANGEDPGPKVAAKTAPAEAVVFKGGDALFGPLDWSQWGGNSARNNTPQGKNIPEIWDVDSGNNIKWVAKVGSQTYGNAVIANGHVYVGTNNGAGHIKRYPKEVDLGCMICFRESDGVFLWQHSNEKLPQGRVVDWQLQGVCCAPMVEGDRLWYVSNRGCVVCLDTQGFYDGENDGVKSEPADLQTKRDADVVWEFDMMAKLGLFQHNMAACSVTCAGDLLFVCTSNGVDESHINIPSPDCPSFICLDKKTGEMYWGDKSPGLNILHGQWSAPAYGELGGVPQVIFAGGDGWLYSFKADKGQDGKPTLLWKFDCNPKKSKWILGGRGTRNNLISTPVIYKDKVYVAVGQDPEHGEGEGHLWCVDPAKKLDGSDVSPELVFDANGQPVAHRRIQAALDGEDVKPNPNSAAIWHYSKHDWNGDGEVQFEEELHRSVSTVCIKDDLLVVSDFSGVVHCVDAKTGKSLWTYDMLAAAWGSALIVDGKVYIGDEDGDVAVFNLSADPAKAMVKKGAEYKPIQEIFMGSSVYSTPVVANNVLFVSTKDHLYAITPGGK